VDFVKRRGEHLPRWRARVRHAGREHTIGHFWTAEEAAKACDEAAGRFHGEFAKPNFSNVASEPAGFSTIEFDWSLGILSVTPHLIVRGSHRWNGKTYKGQP
jgi:hypothetical protein